MKKAVSIGLFLLLLYHTLAYVLVFVGTWWQAEHDLTEQLLVYRTADSIVEFQLPLPLKDKSTISTQATSDGFSYRGHYYDVVSLTIEGDTLHIAGLESQSHSFWQSDLLSFLNNHVDGATDTNQKASQFLKFLQKEYSPTPRSLFTFAFFHWREPVRIPDMRFVALTRALPVHSPPPQG